MPGHNTTDTRPTPLVHKGHTSIVLSVAFAPDGNSLASGSWDDTICTWDAYTPSAIGEPLTGHTSSVFSVLYSPLGDIIASGSWDNTIRLWDTTTRRQVGQPMKAHTDYVNSVAFSPDASLIASGSDDRAVRVWDVKTRQPVSGPFEGHTSGVPLVSFTPDSARIVSGSEDKTILIWDVERGQPVVGPLEGHTNSVQLVSLSPDGSQIISGSWDSTLRLWDTQSGAMIGEPFEGHTGWVDSVSFCLSGIYVASGSGDRTVCVWDVRTGRQVHQQKNRKVFFADVDEALKQHELSVCLVAFSPSGRHIASGSIDETVLIWDVSSSGYGIEQEPLVTIDDKYQELTGSHVSVQSVFDLLSHHGCLDLGPQMDPAQHTAVLMSGGGFGDIWKGHLLNATAVAIKVWRASLIEQCDYKTLKQATRKVYYWSKMKHANVHELMGVVLFKGQLLGMVSEWMENGNLHEYLRKNLAADRHKLSILVASGLAYIHGFNMIHGDIKALNVLVSSDGVAKLTDFGLSIMSESSLEFLATTASQAGSIRWAAPELLVDESAKSKGSDVYALGMTILVRLETFTGNVPYSQSRRDFTILQLVVQGVLPICPTDNIRDNKSGNQLWGLLVRCWDRNVDARPTALQVAELMALISNTGQ
ncbi:unnamed protein product [Rhizoctonia solani]|uniref:Protein kinase domain-containing protein n=1 Tax=Rhizoctonia solani TaxID=456999 RepID=A0A8H2X0W8_9AGAM|nr:unnamed protein product [Rhizoctonia solani]